MPVDPVFLVEVDLYTIFVEDRGSQDDFPNILANVPGGFLRVKGVLVCAYSANEQDILC
jgi:hypothetical protein